MLTPAIWMKHSQHPCSNSSDFIWCYFHIFNVWTHFHQRLLTLPFIGLLLLHIYYVFCTPTLNWDILFTAALHPLNIWGIKSSRRFLFSNESSKVFLLMAFANLAVVFLNPDVCMSRFVLLFLQSGSFYVLLHSYCSMYELLKYHKHFSLQFS